MIQIKASLKNANNELDIEFYENGKLIFEMDEEELKRKINRAIVEEFDRADEYKIYN